MTNPDTLYSACRRRSGTGLVCRERPIPGPIDHDADWGAMTDRAVRTAAAILHDAIGDDASDSILTEMLAEDFAAEVLRILPRHGWVMTAEQVQAWHRAHLTLLAEDATAEFIIEGTIPHAA